MSDFVDLHIHTTASDGSDTPTRVVELAAEAGLRAVAITDHDTVGGIAEAMAAGERLGMEVIPGIEISTEYKEENVHILGFFIDPETPALTPVLDWVRTERDRRNEQMVAMLAADGFDISMEELLEKYPASVLGRPHISEFLMSKGYISSTKEGFDKFLGEGKPYFLPKRRISVAKAVEVIRASGGVPMLAHPLQYHYHGDEMLEMIDYVVSLGVKGMECYYSTHSPEEQEYLLGLAGEYGLAVSGGSDYHGPKRKPDISLGVGRGGMHIPYSVLEELKKLK